MLWYLILVEYDSAARRIVQTEREQDGKHVTTFLPESCRVLEEVLAEYSLLNAARLTCGTVKACSPTTEKKSESLASAG